MKDSEIKKDNRVICFRDYGPDAGIPALWCHGGPGSRAEPLAQADAATAAGFRLIGIDRPGYGKSTPLPGRRIGDFPGDALAVADALGIERFMMIGVSTGGAYALATAAAAPKRVTGVLTCCAMTDMAWAVDHGMMGANVRIWENDDRPTAMRIAAEDFGEDGAKMLEGDDTANMLAPADVALLMDPAFAATFSNTESFAQGVTGYADDRLADAPRFGWSSFDINQVSCPVQVIHGEADGIVPIIHSHHTAEIVRDAELQTYSDHGHLSVIGEVVPGLIQLQRRISN